MWIQSFLLRLSFFFILFRLSFLIFIPASYFIFLHCLSFLRLSSSSILHPSSIDHTSWWSFLHCSSFIFDPASFILPHFPPTSCTILFKLFFYHFILEISFDTSSLYFCTDLCTFELDAKLWSKQGALCFGLRS